VQYCLDEFKAGANAVELLNELQQRRKGKKQDEALSDQQPQDIPCQVKTPKQPLG
jgi:hypothetical protein